MAKNETTRDEKSTLVPPPVAFVAMPTHAEIRHVYNRVIRPALEAQGVDCVFPGETLTIETTVDEMQDQIGDADFVVCDLTEEVAEVFYQLGIAHALGKPVIMLSQTAANLPFRVQRRRIIQYEDSNVGLLDLRDRLEEHLAQFLSTGLRTTPSAPAKRLCDDAQEVALQRRALYSDSASARRFAIKFLGECRDADAFPLIEQIVKKEWDPDTLRDAYTALYRIDPQAARDHLVRGLFPQDSHLVRERLVLLLGYYQPDREVVERMIDQLTDSSWGVRRAVCQVLGQWGKAIGLGPLRELLNDDQLQVRMAAAEAYRSLVQSQARLERAQQAEIPGKRRAELRSRIDKEFDWHDLRDLCFDLNIDYRDLEDEGPAGLSRELIAYCERRRRMDDLLEALSRARPDDKYWQQLPKTFWH